MGSGKDGTEKKKGRGHEKKRDALQNPSFASVIRSALRYHGVLHLGVQTVPLKKIAKIWGGRGS